MRKRIISLILCALLVVSLLPVFGTAPVHAATASQNNIVARADYLYGIKWTAKKTVYGWCKNYVFNSGSTYRIPYGQPINSGYYIGFGVSVDKFLSATKSASSVFYTSRSTYSGTSSVYYAMDCSAFVSWCWGISRKTTYSIPQVSTNLGKATTANISKLQLGDALNSSSVGHVVLVTGLTYSGSTLTKIEITEQTPPQLKRSTYTPAALASKYGGSYTIQRYSGTVPAAPGSSGSSGSSSESTGNYFVNGYENGYKGGMAGDGKIYAQGLDVSSWQGSSLDFTAIKNAGYQYVILRAGTTNGKDSCFETFYTNAKKAGLNVGAYYYSYATSVSGAQTDAKNMLSWIKGKTFEYPIYFDYEDPSQDNLSTATAKNICLTFCDAMAEAGYLTGVYTGYSRSTNLPMSEICAKYEIWIARYYDYTYESLSPTYSKQYGMYQYTDRNYIGSKGPFDANVAYKDYPAIVKKYGFNGYANAESYLTKCSTYPSHCIVTTTQSTPLNSLPCSIEASYGSKTLVTAEANQTYTAKALYKNAAGNYWYAVTLSSGETAYLYSGHCQYTKSSGADLTLSDAFAPGILPQGEDFRIDGTVLSQHNKLEEVQVLITDTQGTIVASTTGAAADDLCELSGLTLDFKSLTPGTYVYQILGKYSGKYASSATTIAGYSGKATLMKAVFTVVSNEPGAEPEEDPYLEQCTMYPTYCQVVATAATPLNTLPSSAAYNGSQTLLTALEGQSFVANGICCNTGGTYWYRIKLESGQTVYLASNYAQFVEYVSDDLSVSDATAPQKLEPGEHFELQGTVRSQLNKLDEVQVLISDAEGATVAAAAAGAMDNLCELSELSLDFASLAPGSYKYWIVAAYSGSYASSKTELADYSAQSVLLESSFTVGDSADDTNPEHDPYLDKCTFYPAHCKVIATQTTPLNTLPSSTAYNGSQTVVTAEAGESFVANALCRNTGSTYWYQITLQSGETVYLSSNHSTCEKYDSSDITLTKSTAPGILLQAEPFKLEGTVRGRLNKLETVQVMITTADGTPVTSASGAVLDNRCELSSMTLDFAALETGNYLYRVVAQYSGSFATAPKERADYSDQVVLMETSFSVIVSDPEAEDDPYLDRCTVYPAHCWVTTTQATTLNTLPSSTAYNGSQTVLTVTENQTYLASALYCNTGSTYWYQIVLEGGQIAYLSSNHSEFAGIADTDISLSGAAVPEELYLAEPFELKGLVQSSMHKLNGVRVEICDLDGAVVEFATGTAEDNLCDLMSLSLTFGSLEAGSYLYRVIADYSGSYASAPKERVDYSQQLLLLETPFTVKACVHSFETNVVQGATCTQSGILEEICTNCGKTTVSTLESLGHKFTTHINEPTCMNTGATVYQCIRCDHNITEPISALGHSYENGKCTTCGEADPNYVPTVTKPTLTLKAPTLEFKDTITVNAFYTAENIQDVVEMGMITYSTKVSSWSVATAENVIPGATYNASTGRYVSCSQGIHAKYLGDTVYLAIYAKLSDGTYAYSKLAGYSPVQYATSQLKGSDTKLKQLVVAMLNYGAEAQLYFGHNTSALANASLTAEQKALPAAYNSGMVSSVASAPAEKQGIFANNQGFAKRTPSISFEGAFCINYFFTPKYAPDSGITMYYWYAEDYNAASVLTTSNASGKIKLEGSGTGQYQGDIEGIAAKALSEAVYVACAYRSGGTVWTSGVLGYSIGSYCSSQASKGSSIAELAKATAVYGYHAKAYFG